MRRQLLFLILIFACSLSATNFFAEKFDLYNSIWWIDIICHCLGGMVVAGGFIYLSWKKNKVAHLLPIFTFVLIVGVAWEFYELYTGFMHTTDPGYYLDTATDICLDMFGAYIMYLLSKKLNDK